MTEESKSESKDKPEEHEYPMLESVKNILSFKCSERVSKMLAYHVSKFGKDDSSVHKDVVSIVHYCLPQNKLTFDGYYIVKNIIYSILNQCPETMSFFKLLDHDINVDIFYNDSKTLKRDYTEIFIKFMKKLRELKLDYNIVVFISQVDGAYFKNNLHNFVFLLRQAMGYFPPYLKFVLTLTSDSIIELDEISRILMLQGSVSTKTSNDIQLTTRDMFDKYGETGITLLEIPTSISKQEMNLKGEQDFERILDYIEMTNIGIDASHVFNKYDLNFASFISGIDNSSVDANKNINIIRILSHLKMPISIEMLSLLCGIDEDTLLSLINGDLSSVVWTFTKRVGMPNSSIEESKQSEDEPDDTIYACINSVNYFEYENSIEIHNEIVRVLRKEMVASHYTLHCLWYHVSEGDDDYTKDYLEEEDHKIEPAALAEIKDGVLDDDPEEKAKDVTFFDLYDRFFKSKAVFRFIEYHKSFEFLTNELGYIICSHQTDIIEKERSQLLNFRNILYLIEQTLKNEKLGYSDFGAQLRGRLIGEEEKSLMYKLRLDITNQRGTYFKGFQNSLRENAKIETILKFPFSVNKTGLFTDQRRAVVFSDSGLIYIISTDFEIISIISSEYTQINGCQYFSLSPANEEQTEDEELDEEYIFTAGNDPHIRKWDINSQREVATYKCHKSDGTLLVLWNEFLFSTGSDNRLVKFSIEKEKIDAVYK